MGCFLRNLTDAVFATIKVRDKYKVCQQCMPGQPLASGLTSTEALIKQPCGLEVMASTCNHSAQAMMYVYFGSRLMTPSNKIHFVPKCKATVRIVQTLCAMLSNSRLCRVLMSFLVEPKDRNQILAGGFLPLLLTVGATGRGKNRGTAGAEEGLLGSRVGCQEPQFG